jgi:hypothetical protein
VVTEVDFVAKLAENVAVTVDIETTDDVTVFVAVIV